MYTCKMEENRGEITWCVTDEGIAQTTKNSLKHKTKILKNTKMCDSDN